MHNFLLLFVFITATVQKPKDGTYTYAIAYAEWSGKSMGETCTVVIWGDSIRVQHNDTKEILEEGIIMKHRKTGKWIIGHSAKDKAAKEVGGCSDGPVVIDFERKRFWRC